MVINRRDFIKTAGVAGAALLGPHSSAEAASQYVSPEWMGMLTDLSLCIGCRKCEYACNDANGLPNEPLKAFEDKAVFDEQRRTDADTLTVVNQYEIEGLPDPVYVKKQCMHCIEPACASACLVNAFTKADEGPVLYNEDVCIGCRYCMNACPFSIPAFEYSDAFSPAITKCTMCYSRFTEEGKPPACAEICPEEAITFAKRSDLIQLAREKIRSDPDRYVDHIYGEHEAAGTNWLYVSPVPFDEAIGFRSDVGNQPYPGLTKGALSVVPLILVIWPMMLMGAYSFGKKAKEGEQAKETPEGMPGEDVS